MTRLTLLILGIALSACGMAMPRGGIMGASGESSGPDAIEGATELEVEAFDFGFRPAELVLAPGETVNITVANTGRVLHDLTIVELDFSIVVALGDSVTSGFEVPEAGTYEFLCTVPGHASAGMVGTLVVP